MNTVSPRVRWSVRIRSSNWPAPIGSRPEVGSSRKTISGSSASARERDALGHAARQLRRELVADIGPQCHHAELDHRDLLEQAVGQTEELAHRELDVLAHRE